MTAEEIIDLLGGLQEVRRELGVPRTTVQSWMIHNSIPDWRRDSLLLLALKLSKPLSVADFPDKPRKQAA